MKKKTKMRPTSLLAYAEVLGNISERQSQVYKVIRSFDDKGCNNKMIARELRLPINSVTGRVNELRRMWLVFFLKKEICPITLETENKERLTIFWKVRRKL